jgi:type VI protein secretion system component VasF
MPQPSPAQVWERRRRRRQFFAWIVTVLLLAALVYGWLWVYGVL